MTILEEDIKHLKEHDKYHKFGDLIVYNKFDKKDQVLG